MIALEVFQHPALPLLTFLAGLLIGHRTALWRDRRKELNEAREPVRAWLLGQIAKPSPYGGRIGDVERDRLVMRLPRRRRRQFSAAWQAYEETASQKQRGDHIGQVRYTDSEAVREALRRLLPFTDPD